jgi:hypothetical protein
MMRRDAQTAIRGGNAVSGEAHASESSRIKHGKLAGDITNNRFVVTHPKTFYFLHRNRMVDKFECVFQVKLKENFLGQTKKS